MPDVQLTENERKVLSYMSRGISKDTAVDKISKFFSMTPNDVMGVINSLRKQNLVIESKGVGGGVVVYTTSPLKVKSSMLDPHVIELLKEAEQGGRASGFKKKSYSADPDTGEIRDSSKVANIPGPRQPKLKPGADLGFDLQD